MAEARLFLVPQAMVFIPGALLNLEQLSKALDSTKIRYDSVEKEER
jgi:hypothetical protein